MVSSFAKIRLPDWEKDRVEVSTLSGDGEPYVLYRMDDGSLKIPILVVIGDSSSRFIGISPRGLEEKKQWDANKKQFSSTWAGDWKMGFRITQDWSKSTELQTKLMDIFQDMESKIGEAHGANPTSSIKYSYEKTTNKFGKPVNGKFKDEGPVYMDIKTGYKKYDESIPDQEDGSPPFNNRVPKTEFHDIDRAKDQTKVHYNEAKGRMEVIPEIALIPYSNGDRVGISRKLLKAYYRKIRDSSGEDDILGELRTMSISEQAEDLEE